MVAAAGGPGPRRRRRPAAPRRRPPTPPTGGRSRRFLPVQVSVDLADQDGVGGTSRRVARTAPDEGGQYERGGEPPGSPLPSARTTARKRSVAYSMACSVFA